MDFLLRLLERHRAVSPEVVEIYVTEPARLRQDVAEHAVIGVADVAAPVTEERITRVPRGERLRLWIRRVRIVPAHHVTRTAEGAVCSSFHAGDGRGSCGD